MINRLLCSIFGHYPDVIITGFKMPGCWAIGRCRRCNIPIVLTYRAAPFLMDAYEAGSEMVDPLEDIE